MEQVQSAIGFYEQLVHQALERNDREGLWLGNRGACISNLWQNTRDIEYYDQRDNQHRGHLIVKSSSIATVGIQMSFTFILLCLLKE